MPRTSSDKIRPGLRYDVLERDGYRCFYCRSDGPLVVDHVVPLAAGGPTRLDNLAAACEPCNVGKSDKQPPDSVIAEVWERTDAWLLAIGDPETVDIHRFVDEAFAERVT